MIPASYPSCRTGNISFGGTGPFNCLRRLTPILFFGFETLGVSRAVNMFIGIRRVLLSFTLHDLQTPFF